MARRPLVNVRLAGYCGLAAPVVAFACIILAIWSSSWFTWTGSWLSDLGGMPGQGTPAVAGVTAAFLFNNGLMLAALLGLGLVGGLWGIPMLDSPWGRRGLVLLALDMVALFGVGLWPSNVGVMHYYASVTFFLLIPPSLLALGHALAQAGEKGHAHVMRILGAIALVTVPLIELLPQPWGHNALSEAVPAVVIGAASAVAGHWLLGIGEADEGVSDDDGGDSDGE